MWDQALSCWKIALFLLTNDREFHLQSWFQKTKLLKVEIIFDCLVIVYQFISLNIPPLTQHNVWMNFSFPDWFTDNSAKHYGEGSRNCHVSNGSYQSRHCWQFSGDRSIFQLLKSFKFALDCRMTINSSLVYYPSGRICCKNKFQILCIVSVWSSLASFVL